MAASPRSPTPLLGALLLWAGPLGAQSVITGRVVSTGEPVRPVPGIQVVLHRVSASAQGVIDSVVAGPGGRFSFRLEADTAAVYLVSTQYRAINYFADPLPGEAVREGAVLELAVADTSATQPLELVARRLLVGAPEEADHRDAIEVVVLRNQGPHTRVVDSTGAVLRLALPDGVHEVELLDGDFSPEALEPEPNGVRLTAPISPGVRQFVLRYALPTTHEVRWTLDAPVDSLEVLFEEPGASAAGVPPAPPEPGAAFARYAGTARTGTVVTLRFGRGSGPPEWVVPALVAVLLAGFALAMVRMRRAGRRPAAPVPSGSVELADRIARLDRELATAGDDPAAARLRAQRERLHAELERTLASGRGAP